jgi:hypothetical protein
MGFSFFEDDMEIGGKRSKALRGGRKPSPKSMIQGVVKSRKCRHCGHHEIGIVTKSGEYRGLKRGVRIMVFPDDEGDDGRSEQKVRDGGSKS